MALIQRRITSEVETGRVKKRRRVENQGRSEGSVLERLPWKEVPFPERFEDAEGFFGLEEISDVEVTKDEEGGKISYKVDPDRHEERPKSFKTRRVTGGITSTLVRQGNDAVDDEWEGCGDETSIYPPSEESDVNRDGKARESKRCRKGKKRKTTVNSVNGARHNSFEALNEAEEDYGDISAWHPLGLAEETLSALARLKFSQPTPIQRAAIPAIIDGHDIIGKAPTGSGKTLAFGIPIYQHYLSSRASEQSYDKANIGDKRHSSIALIISPTRELAYQLASHISNLCENTGSVALSIATLTGGMSVHKQKRLLANAHVIICTPGRLWEMMNDDPELTKRLRSVKFLVLDEADRLLSEGHFKEVDEILNSLDRGDLQDGGETEASPNTALEDQRQTLVFSATFQKDLQRKLAGKDNRSGSDSSGRYESMEYLLKKLQFREEKPRFLDMNPVSQMAENLKEGVVECPALEKDIHLYALLLHHAKARTLVFVNSIHSVRRLTPFLQNLNLQAYALHSQMPQKSRLRSVERFSSSLSSILIATDVAARGLDIPSVQLIVHYHVPRAADMYVHRSGRTARAQKPGSSVLLCAPEEVQGVRRLVAKMHARNASTNGHNGKHPYLKTIELDRRIIARLKSRVTLSKKIADASLAKEKKGHDDNWLRTAAHDLGVDFDSDEFAADQGTQKGKGQGRRKREKEARGLSKNELATLKAQLIEQLKNRVNVGVSERYLTAGGLDVDELLEEKEQGQFLGRVDMAGVII